MNGFDLCRTLRTEKPRLPIVMLTAMGEIDDKLTGLGFGADELSTIFDPFFRASSALGYAGSGLGLSICRRIVEVHNGQLLVESGVGMGSTFTVLLPNG